MTTAIRFRNAILNSPAATLLGTRVYAKYAPDDALAGKRPWAVVDRISTTRASAHDGDGRYTEIVFQVTVGGSERETVENVKDILIESLHGYQYVEDSGDIVLLVQDERDDWDPANGTFTSQIDFFVTDNN